MSQDSFSAFISSLARFGYTNPHSQAWLRSSEAWTEGGVIAPRVKRVRLKAHQWLIAVDNNLRQYTGHGLQRYTDMSDADSDSGPKPFDPDDPYAWPWLGVALDRGPDSWCAKQFLKYKLHCNVEEFPDQSHDNWNDMKMSLREAGLGNHVLIMILAMNLAHAPFDDGKWFEMIKMAFDEYYALASCADPIFLTLLPRILADWDELHRIHEPDIARAVWDRLPQAWCWKRRGAKVGMCRFFGYITATGPYRKIFHTKLLGMMYLGLRQGWLRRDALKNMTKATLKVKDHGAGKKQTMKQSRQEVSKLFGVANALQLVTMAKLEPEAYFTQCMIEVSAKPVTAWHQHQNKTLRSCGEAGPWFIEQAKGGFLVPVCDTFATLWRAEGDDSVASMGFHTNNSAAPGFFPPSLANLQFGSKPAGTSWADVLTHPSLLGEEERARTTLKFQLNLASNRIQRCCWAMRGWPAQSCLLGDEDAAVRARTIATLKEDYEGYLKCVAHKPGFFGSKALSVFNTRPVQQVLAIMKAAWLINGNPAILHEHFLSICGASCPVSVC